MAFFGLFGGGDKKYKQQLELQKREQAAAAAAQQAAWAREDAQQQQQVQSQQAEAARVAAENSAKRQTALTGAQGLARTSAEDVVKQWGLDPSQYGSQIDSRIAQLVSGIGESADPYSAIDGSQIASQLLNTEQSSKRSGLTAQADSKFGVNYGDKLIGGNLLDSVVSDILGTQSTEAQSYLDRGKARGIYNDVGYSAGQDKLTQQAQAGRSQVSTLADSVLDTYRTKANDVRDKAYNVAGNATLSQNINLDDYIGMGNDVLNKATDRADDDLMAAVGGANYFDLSGLTNAAGAAQGVGNFRDSSITGALAERNKQKLGGRGLGSQGVF